MCSRLLRWLQDRKRSLRTNTFFGLRDKPRSYTKDFFASPTIRKLEPRRVLTVSAVIDGAGLVTIDMLGDTEDVTILAVDTNADTVLDTLRVTDVNAALDFDFVLADVTGFLINDDDGADVDSVDFLSDLTLSGGIETTDVETIVGTGGLVVGSILDIGGAEDVTLTNVGNDFQASVNVESTNAAIVDSNDIELGDVVTSGSLSVTATGNLTQSGTITSAGTTTLSAANITLADPLNDFVGKVTINPTGDVVIADANDLLIAATADNLTATAGGNIDLCGVDIAVDMTLTATGDVVQSGTVFVDGLTEIDAANVTLADPLNDFVGKVTINPTGDVEIADANDLLIAVTADNLTATAGGNIDLCGVDIAVDMTLTATGDVVQSGTVFVDGLTEIDAANVTLADPLNDFVGKVTINPTGDVVIADANDLLIAATADNLTATAGGNIDLCGVDIAVDMTLTATGDVVQSGTVFVDGLTEIDAANVTLADPLNDFVGKVTINPTGDVVIADANDLLIAATADNLTATAGGNIDLCGVDIAVDMTLTATGDVVQSGTVFVDGLTEIDAANVTLADPLNDFVGKVTINPTGDVVIADANDLLIAATADNLTATAGGNIDLCGVDIAVDMTLTATGDVVQSGTVFVDGLTEIDAANVTLADPLNDFVGKVTINPTGDVVIADANDLLIAATADNLTATAGGNIDLCGVDIAVDMTLTATGDVVQSGTVFVDGLTEIDAANVTLADPLNDFVGKVTINPTGDVVIADANDLLIAATADNLTATAGGNIDLCGVDIAVDMTLTATGDVVQSGTVFVDGLTEIDAANVTLADPLNDFVGKVTINPTGDVVIADANDLLIAATADNLTATAGGNIDLCGVDIAVDMTLAATGDVVQSGTVFVDGLTEIDAANVTLADPLNDFVGKVTINPTGDVVIADANDLLIAATADNLTATAGGNIDLCGVDIAVDMTLTATGDVVQSGTVFVDGLTEIDAANVTLADPLNDFVGKVTINPTGDVVIADANDLLIAATADNLTATAGGNIDLCGVDIAVDMTLTATGDVVQSGTVFVDGLTEIDAANVTLADPLNDFVGKVTINPTGDVVIADANDLLIAATADNLTATAGGNIDLCGVDIAVDMTLTATGDVVQSGTVFVDGLTEIDAANVTLADPLNDFVGKVTITSVGGDIVISDVGDLVLAATSDSLTATAGGSVELCGASISGNMLLTTGGDITQSDVVAVGLVTTINLTNPGGNVYLHGDAPFASGPNEFANVLDGAFLINGHDAGSDVEIRNDSATAVFPAFDGNDLNRLIVTHTLADLEIATPAGGLVVQDDLILTSGGDLSDSATDLTVMGDATIVAEDSIILSELAELLSVDGKASFDSQSDDIVSVGAGTAVTFGMLRFDGGTVTIVETDSINLCDASDATNLELTSLTGDILDEANAQLFVEESAILTAVTEIRLGDDSASIEFGHNLSSNPMSLSSDYFLTLNAVTADLVIDSNVNLRNTGVGFDVNDLTIVADGQIIQVDGSGGGEILVAGSADFTAQAVILTDTDFDTVTAVLTGSADVQELDSDPNAEVVLPLDIPNESNTGVRGTNDLTPISAPGGSVAGSDLYGQVIDDGYGFVISNHGDLDVGEMTSSNGSIYIETLLVGNLTFEGNVSVDGNNHAVTAVAGGVLEIDTTAYGGTGAFLTTETGAVGNVGGYTTFSSVVFPPGFAMGTGPLLQITQPNNTLGEDGSNTISIAGLTPIGWLVEFELEIGSVGESNFIIASAFIEDLEIMYDINGDPVTDINGNIVLEPVGEYSITHIGTSTFDVGIDSGTGYTTVGGQQTVDQDLLPDGTDDTVVDFEHVVPYSILNSDLADLLPDAPTFFRVFNDPLVNLYQGVNVSQSATIDRMDAMANPNFLDLNESLVNIPDGDIQDPNHPQAIYGGYTFETFIPTAIPIPEVIERDPSPELDLPTPLAKPGLSVQESPPIEFDDDRPFVIQAVEKVQYGPVDEPGGEFTEDPETYEGSTSDDVVQKVRDKIDGDDNYEPGNYEIQVFYTDGSFDEFQHVKEFETEESEQEISASEADIVHVDGEVGSLDTRQSAWAVWRPVGNVEVAGMEDGLSQRIQPQATAAMAAAMVARRVKDMEPAKRQGVNESLATQDWSRMARLRRRIASHLFTTN